MNDLTIPVLREALRSAGEDARRAAENIRRDDYRNHRYGPGLPAAWALSDALTQDRYGHSTIADRYIAQDRTAAPTIRDRAKHRITWKTDLSQALLRLSMDAAQWRAVVDALADGSAINVYQLDMLAEAA